MTVILCAFVCTGIIAGGGRIDKPMLKAGRAYHKYKAKRNCWPKVRGVAMNVSWIFKWGVLEFSYVNYIHHESTDLTNCSVRELLERTFQQTPTCLVQHWNVFWEVKFDLNFWSVEACSFYFVTAVTLFFAMCKCDVAQHNLVQKNAVCFFSPVSEMLVEMPVVFITSMHGLCYSRLSIPTVVVTTSISAWPPPSAEIPLLVERSVLFWSHTCAVLQSHLQFGPGYTSTVSGAMDTSECFQAVDLNCVWGHEHWWMFPGWVSVGWMPATLGSGSG